MRRLMMVAIAAVATWPAVNAGAQTTEVPVTQQPAAATTKVAQDVGSATADEAQKSGARKGRERRVQRVRVRPMVVISRKRLPGEAEYFLAISDLDRGRYEDALKRFAELQARVPAAAAESAERVVRRADAAAYWQAYAQHRLGRNQDALSTLSVFSGTFAESAWCNDARALEIEIKQSNGELVRVDTVRDDELKLLALQGLARLGNADAIPAVEHLVFSVNSPRVKERAVFVLAQTATPRAREALTRVVKGAANPDLKLSAFRYLSLLGGPVDQKVLTQMYRDATDLLVKQAVVKQLLARRDGRTLVDLARQEKDAELKKSIVRALTALKSKESTDYLIEILK